MRDAEAATQLDERWLYLAELYEESQGGKDKEAAALKRYLALRDDPVAANRLVGN